MPTTRSGLPYTTGEGHTNLWLHLQQLAEGIETHIKTEVPNPAARLALTSTDVSPGTLVTETETGQVYLKTTTGWQWIGGTPPGWTNLSLASGYQAPPFSGGAAQYRKVGDRVELRGVIFRTNSAELPQNVTLATLPAGYRPTANRYPICQGTNDGIVNLQINPNGTIVVKEKRNPTGGDLVTHWVSLDCVVFGAEQ